MSEVSSDSPPYSDPDIEPPWHRQTLRVPREDLAVLTSCRLDEAAAFLRQNRSELDGADADIQGKSLSQLRRWTREAALAAARHYTAEQIGQPVPGAPCGLLAVTGHQPSLFHPGVWVKNFAVHQLAEQTGGIGLNLVVDTDTFSSSRMRVPTGDADQPTIQSIPFDAEQPAQPWENVNIRDAGVFQSFPGRVRQAMASWPFTPLLAEFWPRMAESSCRTSRLADCLTGARHRLERRWGLRNLELPISQLCCSDPFLWFASHVMAHLPRFRRIYNDVLLQYRQVNRVRSRTHPVPELATKDDWLEAPFWVWRSGEWRRKHAFVKQMQQQVLLSDGVDVLARLPLTPGQDASRAVEVLRELPAQGIHLRTRALTTTLFARLCLSDLFVHGIGGAKYDEMTERIIARFFQLKPPAFLTLSATAHLPLAASHDVSPRDETRLLGTLRDLRFNPQRYLSAGVDRAADEMLAQKSELIEEQHAAATSGLSRRQRRGRSRVNRERYRRFQAMNDRLAALTASRRNGIECELETARKHLKINRVLRDREFSFALFPEEKLRAFLTGFWGC